MFLIEKMVGIRSLLICQCADIVDVKLINQTKNESPNERAIDILTHQIF